MEFLKLITLVFFTMSVSFLVRNSHSQNTPEDYLNVHNLARAQVGVVPITWNTSLEAKAKEVAKQRTDDCNLIADLYGENIAEASYAITGSEAIQLWVRERPYYNYDKNKCDKRNCLHYTQVVWNKSRSVGCARAQCKKGLWFVSCNYYPLGNFPLQRPYEKH